MFYKTSTTLLVQDEEGIIPFTRDDLIKYAGHGQLIASGVIMRLLGLAFKELSPEEPPVRNEIKVLTAYPGRGIWDGLEMVTRCVTQNRFIYMPGHAHKDAPHFPDGTSMYFEIAYKGKARGYAFSPRIFTPDWLEAVRKYQNGSNNAETHAEYMNLKFKIVADLLTSADAVKSFEVKDSPLLAGS